MILYKYYWTNVICRTQMKWQRALPGNIDHCINVPYDEAVLSTLLYIA